MKATLKNIAEIKDIYAEKGLNAVYAYIKRNSLKVEINEHCFGFGYRAACKKDDFLKEKTPNKTLRFHYCSVLRTCKNGFRANLIRAIEFVF